MVKRNIIKYLNYRGKMTMRDDSVIEIHILTSHGSIDMCLAAIASFSVNCGAGIFVVIHDDGTLVQDDRDLVNKYFIDVKIIGSRDADKEVLPILSGYKYCRRFRRESVFAKKLFDMYFFAKNNKYMVVDTDVLFFSYPSEIIDWFMSPKEYITYNWDPYDYSQLFLKKISKDLMTNYKSGLNTGMFCFVKKMFDLSLLEEYLRYFYENNGIEWVTEQNCFNLLSSRTECIELSRDKYFFQNKRNLFYRNREINNFSKNIVAKHYSRYARSYFVVEGIKYLLSNYENSYLVKK